MHTKNSRDLIQHIDLIHTKSLKKVKCEMCKKVFKKEETNVFS